MVEMNVSARPGAKSLVVRINPGAEVVFGVLDADTAGREASDRLGAAIGARWRPIELPDGCDLNDLGRRPDGRALFFRLVAAAGGTLKARGL